MTEVLGERLVIVDRDGVINEDSHEYIKSVAEWRQPGMLAGRVPAFDDPHAVAQSLLAAR